MVSRPQQMSAHPKEIAHEAVDALGIPVWTTDSGEVFVDRVTIVVRKGGTVAHVFEDVMVEGHVEEVIDVRGGL